MPCKCKIIENVVEIKIQWYDNFGNKLAAPITHEIQKTLAQKKFIYNDIDKEIPMHKKIYKAIKTNAYKNLEIKNIIKDISQTTGILKQHIQNDFKRGPR